MKPVMLIDFGSTFTKVCGIDMDTCEIIGTSKAFTTIDSDICIGLQNAINILEKRVGHIDWQLKYGCSSAAGGLRMVAVGLVQDLTSKAASEAALSAGAKVLKVYSMELTQDDIEDINSLDPDILLLTGGTDGGNQKVVCHNAKLLATLSVQCPIIYSGNRSVKSKVVEILQEGNKEVIPTENVMPSFGVLNILPAREAIKSVFLDKIIEAKGIKNAENLIDNVLMPTPLAVMNGAKLLGDGYSRESGLGDLIVVDIGGATTDIHSVSDGLPSLPNVVLKGIEEPRVKRSVEGDLGARYSLGSAIEISNKSEIANKLKIDLEHLNDLIEDLILNPDKTGNQLELDEKSDLNEKLIREFDDILAELVTKESVTRHSGKLKEHFTPFGMSYEQFGKDLSGVTTIIGTGGPLIHAKNPKRILESGGYSDTTPFILKPKLSRFYLDQEYILGAMGLLASIDSKIAYTILINHIQELK